MATCLPVADWVDLPMTAAIVCYPAVAVLHEKSICLSHAPVQSGQP